MLHGWQFSLGVLCCFLTTQCRAFVMWSGFEHLLCMKRRCSHSGYSPWSCMWNLFSQSTEEENMSCLDTGAHMFWTDQVLADMDPWGTWSCCIVYPLQICWCKWTMLGGVRSLQPPVVYDLLLYLADVKRHVILQSWCQGSHFLSVERDNVSSSSAIWQSGDVVYKPNDGVWAANREDR